LDRLRRCCFFARFVAVPLLFGLASCQRGPETVCLTPQTTCALDSPYAQTGTECYCSASKGLAATR
jgi:hypothetical protein